MKGLRHSLLASALLFILPCSPLLCVANAQTASVTPVPLPSIGTVPGATPDEQKTHDAVTIQQLLYVVELSRTVAGGVSQIFSSAQTMTSLLGAIRDTASAQLKAITGTKTIPLANGPDEIKARDGGTTIREMAIEGLGGSLTGPVDVASAYTKYATTYKLDKAFAYQNGETLAETTIAHAASNGAVAASISEQSYKRANESMGRLDGYIIALGASTDLKTSLDINTRVNIEIAQQMNEMLRNQAALTTLAGFYFMNIAGVHADMDNNLDFTRLKDMFQ
jgi:hypothetical protein